MLTPIQHCKVVSDQFQRWPLPDGRALGVAEPHLGVAEPHLGVAEPHLNVTRQRVKNVVSFLPKRALKDG